MTEYVIVIGLALVTVAMAVVLMCGRGAWLIAGFNMLSRERRARYDAPALCRFMGKILLPIGALMPLAVLSEVLNAPWIAGVYVAIMLTLTVFALVYTHTWKRFER